MALAWLRLVGFTLALLLQMLYLHEAKGDRKRRAFVASAALFFLTMAIWQASEIFGL